MKTTSCFRTLRIASALRAFYLIVLIVARDILPANTLGVKSPTQGVLEHLPATIPRCDNVTACPPARIFLCGLTADVMISLLDQSKLRCATTRLSRV